MSSNFMDDFKGAFATCITSFRPVSPNQPCLWSPKASADFGVCSQAHVSQLSMPAIVWRNEVFSKTGTGLCSITSRNLPHSFKTFLSALFTSGSKNAA